MPSFYWYPVGGSYNNLNSTSTSWRDAKSHFYLSKNYDNKISYNIDSASGWEHNGRKIKIDKAVFQVRRNDGETSTGTMKIYREGNSNAACSGSVSANTGNKLLNCTTLFLTDLADYVNSGNTNIIIKLSGTDDDNSGYIRVCGYNNTAYIAEFRPRFSISWSYALSSAQLNATQFMYTQTPILTITPNVNTDYHTVDWYINNESTPYHSESLPAGSITSSCTFFGSNPSGQELDSTVYFSTQENITAKAILTTYTSAGISLGSQTYTFTLRKPLGGSIILIGQKQYRYDDIITASILPVSNLYTHLLNFYVGTGDMVLSQEIGTIPENEVYEISDHIYQGISLDKYFSQLSNTCPGYVILTTYDLLGNVMGISRADFVLKDSSKQYISAEISVNPMVSTESIIATNPITYQTDTVKNILNSFKEELMNKLYPIGSIFITTSQFNLPLIPGTTWTTYSSARTLLSTTAANEINNVGGSFDHVLTVEEMPQHRHGLYYTAGVVYTGTSQQEYGAATSGSTSATSSVGEGKAHNNTQPYEICYMWMRTN